jgi:hypothetical protein
MVVVQELIDRDIQNRSKVAERLIGILSDDVIVLMTDEARFHFSGFVKKENFRCWTEKDPQQLYERPLHCARVTVWCGVANFRGIGLYFFEDEDWRAITVTSARHVEMLRNFLTPELSRRGTELSTIWFSKMVHLPIQREHP